MPQSLRGGQQIASVWYPIVQDLRGRVRLAPATPQWRAFPAKWCGWSGAPYARQIRLDARYLEGRP